MSNPSASANERIIASPYARRLARERGLPLEGRRGSDPNGRIVARDLDSFVPLAEPGPAAPPVSPAAIPVHAPIPQVEARAPRHISGFAVTLDLRPVTALLPDIAKVAPAVSLDDFLLKALGRALVLAGSPASTIVWQDGPTKTVIVRADELSPSRIATLRSQGPASVEGPAITVTRIRENVRPVSAALEKAMALRLVLAGEGDVAEALLVFDEAVTDAAVAARLLAALRDCLGHPLRLLV